MKKAETAPDRITDKGFEQLSAMFAALANPHRLRMYRRLRTRELECSAEESTCSYTDRCCNVGELAADLNIHPATVSHHLKELSRAGLVATKRTGRFVYCSLNHDAFVRLAAFLRQVPEDFEGVAAAVRPGARNGRTGG